MENDLATLNVESSYYLKDKQMKMCTRIATLCLIISLTLSANVNAVAQVYRYYEDAARSFIIAGATASYHFEKCFPESEYRDLIEQRVFRTIDSIEHKISKQLSEKAIEWYWEKFESLEGATCDHGHSDHRMFESFLRYEEIVLGDSIEELARMKRDGIYAE